MTKKHFVSLALHLAVERPDDGSSQIERSMWEACVRAVADTCKLANPAFDRERFTQACETWQAGIRDGKLVRVS